MGNLKAVVPCPHCGSVGTFTTGFTEGNSSAHGSSPAQCNQCHKTFRIEVKAGQLHSTHK